MKITEKKALKSLYGGSGSVAVYEDGSARLKIRIMGKLVHNKVHKNEKAAMAAWYRWER